MKLELKSIKHYPTMSEETYCYESMLYVDGKRIGRVHNSGHGGSDSHDFGHKDFDRINKWCKENLPKWSLESGEETKEFETDLEMWCCDQVRKHLQRKDLKRHLKRLFVMSKDKQFFTYKAKWSEVAPEALEKFKRKHPQDIVLNCLTFDEAFELYQQNL